MSVRAVHRWVALCAGLPFVLVAVTGASMALRNRIEPTFVCAPTLALDTLVSAARKVNPDGGALRALRLYDDAPARVRFSDNRWVYLDPCTARALSVEPIYGGFFGSVAKLHIFGFLPQSEKVAGSMAALFALAMLGGGAVLWWRSRRAPVMSRHKAIAIFAAPLLLVSAATGVPQAFGWGALQATRLAGTQQAALEPMWQRAHQLSPHPHKLQLRLQDALATFEIVASDAPHANAFGYVRFNAQTGALLDVTPFAANSLAHKAYLTAAALHYGWIGGIAGQLLLLFGSLSVPLLAWTGVAAWLRRPRRRRVRIVRKRDEALGVASFELASAWPLPAWTPGAHIDVHVAPGVVRQYSLCGSGGRYRIAVLHTRDSRGGSRAMHGLKEGGIIEIGAPRNHVALVENASRSLLLAGGIGITPILAMADRLHANGAGFEMHYCARSATHAAFHAQLRDGAYASRVHFHFDQPIDLDAVLATPNGELYVCGPAGFMEAVLDAARRHGWREEQLHREIFAGAGTRPGDTPFTLKLARSSISIEVAGNQSASAALAAAGVAVPTSCGVGVCGTCVVRVLEGVPEHRDQFLSAADRARFFTPCCSRAAGTSLTIDL
jgi:vanillate O-demethylase ferredoxin subunit